MDEYLREKVAAASDRLSRAGNLRKKIRAKKALSVLVTVVWYYVWITAAIGYFSRSYATFNPNNVIMYASSLAIIILPFFLFKPQRIFTDRTYYGIISRLVYKNTVGNTTLLKNTNLYIFIKTPESGREKKVKVVMRSGIKEYYGEGQTVLKHEGVKYPERLSEKEDGENVLCLSCGCFNPKRYTRCFECREIIFQSANNIDQGS